MEVTSRGDFFGLLIMNFGLVAALGLLAWRLAQKKLHFLNEGQMYLIWALLAGLYAYQTYQAWLVNRDVVLGKKQFGTEGKTICPCWLDCQVEKLMKRNAA